MTTEACEPARPPAPPESADRRGLLAAYREVRATTESLCAPLETEDYVAQSMPDASPAKWHLGHTGWFFETFLLGASAAPVRENGGYAFLFNSYYNALGDRIARHQRGLITRPTVAEVYEYRARVDDRMVELLESADHATLDRLAPLVVLGLNHEQQHQELMLTDLKHLFAASPVRPVYRERRPGPAGSAPALGWVTYPGGVGAIGHEGGGFAFDNESPRHRVFVEPYELADRPVTAGEYLGFMADGGYDRPEFWLSDGWNACKTQCWTAPAYWGPAEGDPARRAMTLAGVQEVDPAEPVCHVSFYEADAYARWAGARLPTEPEWELAAERVALEGNFLEDGRHHPRPLGAAAAVVPGPRQLFGDVWEWTASPYTPYPGFRPAAGALGEYNGKFMCNQMVLRGGSCATPRSHVRPTYRNFFPPEARWQFSGFRLARGV